ncbi:calpain-A isoform X2 [Procambarus clarkii]|uniref:calpain-A isoform X2 n=1 Tax=Procambarus clarkii TaxID=6728 RepID=UPI001E679001|nr:calpain-A-like isoform X2 [Procambarus clarkii]
MGCGASHSNASLSHDEARTPVNDSGAAPLTVTEEAMEKPKTGEEGVFELPQSDFVDGRLGVTEAKAIEELRSNLAADEHYCDEDFPADNSSLFFSHRVDGDIEWKRPYELHDDPQVFVDGVGRKDVVQGALGDCWFLSACAAVARTPKLIQRVVPPDQVLVGEGYTGLVVCRFWRFGEWVLVCVDDRLPTKEGHLIFASSSSPQEFWVALVEKAYAKLHGSYEALEGGQSMDALVDLTGGLAERYDMEDTPDKDKLYKLLLKSSKNGAFITASMKGDWRLAYKTNDHGLVEGHAYTVSGVATISHEHLGLVRLVRVRNPWASGAEWNGDWSDSDENWDGVPVSQLNKLGRAQLEDGEFWMSFKDFCGHFEEVSICTIGPDFDNDGTIDHVGQVQAIKGEWAEGSSAGGSRNDFDKFATNPQYLLTLTDPDMEEDGESKCSVLVAMMQEHRRSNKQQAVKELQIGFVVYKTSHPERRLSSDYFQHNYEEGNSGVYINFREVLCRMELEPGEYVIIPATFLPDCPGYFMVRVYSPNSFQLKKIP